MIALSLMILLTVLAIGLLGLSSVATRNGARAEAMAAARANARLALALALGELQQQAGPDRRITTTADQLAAGGDGSSSAAGAGRRYWTGVYDAWPAAASQRPAPQFRRWLVSAPSRAAQAVDFAKDPAEQGSVRLVGAGTHGAGREADVAVPALELAEGAGVKSRAAWWVGDQGVKAALYAAPAEEPGEEMTQVRQAMQSAPRDAAELAADGQGRRPFAGLDPGDPALGLMTGWRQSEFLSDRPATPRPLFHDLAGRSTGLLVNVRKGGFRKDLSLHLEKTAPPQQALYTVGGVPGINMAELWAYYNCYKDLKTRTRSTYTTGGAVGTDTPYFQVAASEAAAREDKNYFLKQPAFISYQTVLSFYIRTVTVNGAPVQRLSMVVDPVVTLWNPLDVPLVISPAYYSVKFWQIPYRVKITRSTGGTVAADLLNIVGGGSSTSDGAYQYLTLVIGKAGSPLVMRPGEVLTVSQAGNSVVAQSGGLKWIESSAPGWNFGGGFSYELKDAAGKTIDGQPGESFTYELVANDSIDRGTRDWAINHHETFYKEDRTERGETIGVGVVAVDWYKGMPSARTRATQYPRIFRPVAGAHDTRRLLFSQLAKKEPFLLYSYQVKTELDAQRPGRYLARYNPKANYDDFQTLDDLELETIPYEIRVEPLLSWKSRAFEATGGRGFFGGGYTADSGVGLLATHSVPRQPIHSLAAFQHSFANGFSSQTPLKGYMVEELRSYLMPQISHAIGNSIAPSVIPADRTESSLTGPRPLADHSYLANRELWDDWFLSGIAPQTVAGFAGKRSQQQVAEDFFQGVAGLPNARYRPALHGREASSVAGALFAGTVPTERGVLTVASCLEVDGMFNVNSTSVEAWKALLGGLKGRRITVRDGAGGEALATPAEVPVVSLFAPEDAVAQDSALGDVLDRAQWVGRRELSERQIGELAQAIVREVRKRGPFLSLADFINRRPGSDTELARAGALQSALDSPEVSVNRDFNTGPRAAAAAAPGRAFPDAERGPAAYGIPGVVKQADLLTPIAPYLSARSDTFLVRAYGETRDDHDQVLARAWCEAEVHREAAFIDPADPPEKELTSLSRPVNAIFGRRFEIVCFRWLHPQEV